MARQTITTTDEAGVTVDGWFDLDKAESWDERTFWTGTTHASRASGDEYGRERLWKTIGGRWVRHCWSRWQGVAETWSYITEDEARDWLIRCEYTAEEIETAVGGEVEEERGPGRPEVGPTVKVRLPPEVLARVDGLAAAAGQTRAAWMRDAIATAAK